MYRLVLVLFLFSFVGTNAQEVGKRIPYGSYLGFGIGNTHTSVNESYNTSLPYSGSCFSTVFEGVFGLNNHYFQIRNALAKGTINPYQSTSVKKNSSSSVYENLSFAYYLNWYYHPKYDVYLYSGPMVNAKFGFRVKEGELGNAAMSYEGALSFGLAFSMAKYFNVFDRGNDQFKRFRAGASFSLPLVSKVFTPNYIGISEQALVNNSAIIDWASNYTGYFSNYFNIEAGFSLVYFLKNRNAFELVYGLDYMNTQPQFHPAKTLNQTVAIKLIFNLK